MTAIAPPLTRGERRQPTRSIQVYQSTADKLDKLVTRKNTSRAEYVRWLVDCAEAGIVEIGLQVQEAGYTTLDEFCRAQHQGSVKSYVQGGNDEVER